MADPDREVYHDRGDHSQKGIKIKGEIRIDFASFSFTSAVVSSLPSQTFQPPDKDSHATLIRHPGLKLDLSDFQSTKGSFTVFCTQLCGQPSEGNFLNHYIFVYLFL